MEPIRRFDNRSAYYRKYRPGYPESVVDTLEEEAGLAPGSLVVDVGAGTGISSELFLRRGYRVIAVEPNQEMRRVAEESLSRHDGFRAVDGTAEATGLKDASADLVAAATAFHWFRFEEARREFARILAPGGFAAVMWNVRRKETTPFLREYERLLRAYSDFYAARRKEEMERSAEEIHRLFTPQSFRRRSFPNFQPLDWESLVGRLYSASYAPLPGEERHDAMLADLAAVFARCQQDGQVVMEYDTELYWGRPQEG